MKKTVLFALFLLVPLVAAGYYGFSHVRHFPYDHAVKELALSRFGVSFQSLSWQFRIRQKQQLLFRDVVISGSDQEWLQAGKLKIDIDLPAMLLGRFKVRTAEFQSGVLVIDENFFAPRSLTLFLNRFDPVTDRTKLTEAAAFPHVVFKDFEILRSARGRPDVSLSLAASLEGGIRRKSALSPWVLNANIVWKEKMEIPLSVAGTLDSFQQRAVFLVEAFDREVLLELNAARWNQDARFEAVVKLNGPLFDRFQNLFPEGQESLQGDINSRFQLIWTGSDLESWAKTLTLKGALDLRGGSIRNSNILRDAVQNLMGKESYDALFQSLAPGKEYRFAREDDLPFDILQATIALYGQRLYVSDLKVKHPHYFVEGEGSYGFEQHDIDLRSNVIVMKDFVSYLLQKSPDLTRYQNEVGRIAIPVTSRSFYPGITFETPLKSGDSR